MPTDTLEPSKPLEPKGKFESEAPAWGQDPVLGTGPAEPLAAETVQATTSNDSVEMHARTPKASRKSSVSKETGSRGSLHVIPFAVAFVGGIFGVLLLAAATVFGVSRAYDNRILPGVHVGTVDLSGLNRDQAVVKLSDSYSYLGRGDIVVVTPGGSETISYGQVSRGADVTVMADAALAAGRSSDPISTAVGLLHTLVAGDQIPVVVKVDTQALARQLHAITSSSAVPPTDARVTSDGKTFTLMPSASGRGVDEKAIGVWLVDQLSSDNAPSSLQTDPTYAAIQPTVTDQEAQGAIASAQNMIVDLTVTQGSQSWTIDKAKVKTWIVFGVALDGKFRPAVDPALIKADVATLASKVNVAAVEPIIIIDRTGKPIGVANGKNGITLDSDGTAQAVALYLDNLANTPSSGPYSVALATSVTQPRLTSTIPVNMVIIGSWHTDFFPGESNGNGANIRVPAKVLNGQVVAPGQMFSFFQSVGPIDAAHGFKMGGVIKNGQSNHTGAMGGGICSASTTMFNAAARAGLKIDERHQHFYYIDRYPKGLDATVYSNGNTVWDMRWTNDTPYPIVIRAYATYGSQSRVTFELWSVATGRKVVFSKATQTDNVTATSTTRYVSTLKPGQTYRQEYKTNGFNSFVTRTVTDSSGTLLYFDKFYSHYGKVDGVLQIGGPAPTPKTSPPPPASKSPTPTASKSP